MIATSKEPVGLRERNKARRRRAILTAARSLLRATPERLPTKSEIAEMAEVAPATVYNLVGDRERLWQALADDFFGELSSRLDVAPARDPLERVRQVLEVTVAMFAEDPAVATALLRQWERSGLVLRGGPAVSIRDAVVAAEQKGYLIAKVSPRAIARSITTGCVGAVHQWAAGQLTDAQLTTRTLLGAELALAAVAQEPHRARLLRAVRRRSAEEVG